ncbi:MAG: hypothetical protein V4693_24055 [Pseudomonadota bacterium]
MSNTDNMQERDKDGASIGLGFAPEELAYLAYRKALAARRAEKSSAASSDVDSSLKQESLLRGAAVPRSVDI